MRDRLTVGTDSVADEALTLTFPIHPSRGGNRRWVGYVTVEQSGAAVLPHQILLSTTISVYGWLALTGSFKQPAKMTNRESLPLAYTWLTVIRDRQAPCNAPDYDVSFSPPSLLIKKQKTAVSLATGGSLPSIVTSCRFPTISLQPYNTIHT
ncbi:unnamed protein product [Linum trigynum]|uniref:Uncharacterized protein n=1 Tax=Linum trigynum TaxID=586398 RepID=A0AAV2DT05_9ROSI